MTENYKPSRAGEPLPQDYEMLGREEVKEMLQQYIAELIENQFEKLCNLAYRHDIPESKFNQALVGGSTMDQAGRIADLVIDRELQKVESRKFYREEKRKKSLEQ